MPDVINGLLVTDALLNYVSEKEQFITGIVNRMKNDRYTLKTLIERELRKEGIPNYLRKAKVREIMKKPERILESCRGGLEVYAKAIVDRYHLQKNEIMANAAKQAQIRVLNETIAPDRRIETFKAFSYTVVGNEEHSYILPDCALALQDRADGRFRFISDKTFEISKVILPLSSNRLLIGERDSTAGLTVSQVNEGLAMCSYDFFVSKSDSPENRRLQRLIRTSSGYSFPGDVEELAFGAVKEALEGDIL